MARDLRAKAFDVPTARLILRALQGEFQCLDLQLRYGTSADRVWEQGT